MLLVNLIPPPLRKVNHTKGYLDSRQFRLNAIVSAALLVFGLGLLGSGYWISRAQVAESRPLSVEEREVVIASLQELEAKVTELKHWTSEIRDTFASEDIHAVFEPLDQGKSLVRFENETLTINERFFDADSAAQERALLETIFDIYRGGKVSPAEIAVVGE